jgi:hypothetical protein
MSTAAETLSLERKVKMHEAREAIINRLAPNIHSEIDLDRFLRAIVAELGWPELTVLGQRIGPGEERWRKFCDYPPPWLPAALEVAEEQRRLAADLPFEKEPPF